jgi:hypothetical protein
MHIGRGFAPEPEAPDDDVLLAAIRKRLLREIERENEARQAGGGGGGGGGASSIVNNVYGGSLGGGVAGQLGNAQEMTPEERDYFVDIARQNVPEGDEEMPHGGWRKSVHRYTQDKKKVP